MEKKETSIFETLNKINVNGHTEEKNGLTYLSWAWAWSELKKIYPDAQYTIERFGENKVPYLYDENLGYMVFTSMTVNGLTHDMWLPVMDGANKAMKNRPYTYKVKRYGKIVELECQPATMFDINKTIMRCLVKNIGMFGLGIYIYAGEDLPEDQKEEVKEEPKKEKPKQEAVQKPGMATTNQISIICELYSVKEQEAMLKRMKRKSLKDITIQEASQMIAARTPKEN